LNINNCTFNKILGSQQASLLFAVQNEKGSINLSNSTITNSFTSQALISLTYASMTISDSFFFNNFAKQSSNIISMIYADALITNSTFDNGKKTLILPENIVQNVESGAFNVNYLSNLKVQNCTFKNLYG
jgi:hypothetical protein